MKFSVVGKQAKDKYCCCTYWLKKLQKGSGYRASWRSISRASSLQSIPKQTPLKCSWASQLLAEIPFIIQPTTWLRDLHLPRNRDEFEETGPEADVSDGATSPILQSQWMRLAVRQGSLNMSLKGFFRAENGKNHLDSQCWLGEDVNSQLG